MLHIVSKKTTEKVTGGEKRGIISLSHRNCRGKGLKASAGVVHSLDTFIQSGDFYPVWRILTSLENFLQCGDSHPVRKILSSLKNLIQLEYFYPVWRVFLLTKAKKATNVYWRTIKCKKLKESLVKKNYSSSVSLENVYRSSVISLVTFFIFSLFTFF